MEIARSNPLPIRFSFDPKSLLRQIVEGFARELLGAPALERARMAQAPSLATREPGLARTAPPARAHPVRRQRAYAPRWG
jgi:hypothetical protein